MLTKNTAQPVDWFKHYRQRLGNAILLDEKSFKENLKNDQDYLKLVEKHVIPKGRILETGCGLARTAINLSSLGFDVTCIDHNKKILEAAKINALNFGKKISFLEVDFNGLSELFPEKDFSAITHQGVLEHFDEEKIKEILSLQLNLAPKVIFSVPLDTERNKKYFENGLIKERNLWTEKKWMEILSGFELIEFKKARQRTDNLLVALKRRK